MFLVNPILTDCRGDQNDNRFTMNNEEIQACIAEREIPSLNRVNELG